MATKNKRSLEDGYDAYNPAPFVEHNPTFKYYVDNINTSIYNKFLMSKLILEKNSYKIVLKNVTD